MPSNTTITKARRRIRKRRLGRAQKRERMLAGTPKFPIDPNATADNKDTEKARAAN